MSLYPNDHWRQTHKASFEEARSWKCQSCHFICSNYRFACQARRPSFAAGAAFRCIRNGGGGGLKKEGRKKETDSSASPPPPCHPLYRQASYIIGQRHEHEREEGTTTTTTKNTFPRCTSCLSAETCGKEKKKKKKEVIKASGGPANQKKSQETFAITALAPHSLPRARPPPPHHQCEDFVKI